MPVQNKKAVDRELRRMGLGGLEDPNIYRQMGFLIKNHAHFRQILLAVTPDKRKVAYDCLADKLRFKAKTLEEYQMEGAQLAEQKQLPTYDLATGNVKDWRPQEFNIGMEKPPLESAAEESILQDLRQQEADRAKRMLRLVCRKCTREQFFPGLTKERAHNYAFQDGWRFEDRKSAKGREQLALCPQCAPRPVRRGHA